MDTLFIGKNIVALESVDSTNNYAKDLLAKEKPVEGTIVLAREQHSGRGQMGNVWQTEAGKNLTLSVILYPDFLDADKQFYLNMAISMAVKDFCESVLNDEIKIKWPNDIYHRDNKLGGILIENTISGNRISSSVVGIGINVNQQEFDASLPNPISLFQISNAEYKMESLVELLGSFIEKYYLQLRQLHFNFLDKAYTVALFRYQQTHEFKKGEQVLRGEINGVAKDGKLILHANGKEMRFGFKEVEFVL
ncbi:MAG: biotin--[acetyl-CoA-carboxylase] ligase [Bacteroidetes bacterium]|nr:biotin--[acetyl-CoA-carboxylase] ligase [Bacteroidota bacterium]